MGAVMELADARAKVADAVSSNAATAEGLLIQALEKAVVASESAKSAHHRLDRINGSIDRQSDKLGELDTKLDSAILRVDTAITEVKLEVGKQGVRVGLIAAGASALVTLIITVAAALIVAFLN